MITKEKRIEKICSFYASEYHLEMIMIPYINRKIDEKANIIIATENNLTETIETVISRVNISQKRKREILDINWENSSINRIKQANKNQDIVLFVVGSVEYIDKTNEQIEQMKINNRLKIINCYSIEEVQSNVTEIILKHNKVLNTTEEKEID